MSGNRVWSDTDYTEWDNTAICVIEPGNDFACDRAKVTEDKVLVRKDGVWIELKPFGSSNK
jgi:hypothetical protein